MSAGRSTVSARLRSSRIVALVIALSILPLAGVLTATPPPALAAVATDYPSWQDVANAQANEKAAQAEVTRIKALLAQLQVDVDRTQAEADAKGAIFEAAQAKFDEQAYITQQLQTQADDAQAKADESKKKAGAMLAELSRTGGGDLTASLLSSSQSGNADDLLYRLGAMDQYTTRSEDIYTQAVQQQNNAKALTDQAKVAQAKLEELRIEAQKAFEVAQAAAQAAQEKFAEQEANQAVLEAQLAVLVEKRQATQADYLKGVREKWGPNAGGIISEQGWARPSSGYISSPYGMRYHPIYHEWILHSGVDIAGQGCGATIYAAHSGTVTYAGPNGTLGNYIQIEHGDGTSSGYGHIMPGGIHVYNGQQVDPGQPIAQVGTTGASTGCHLHFIIRIGGQLTNPVPFMSARGITIA
ncbi:MAG TPA: peptidoglycan DD-metalloendopeptidase family protein [Solirubrobacteraceae bacterium]|nr:peptidoglycan DD-metalloendopeptidase family protein [Solirubrobacteraceae bacterium]